MYVWVHLVTRTFPPGTQIIPELPIFLMHLGRVEGGNRHAVSAPLDSESGCEEKVLDEVVDVYLLVLLLCIVVSSLFS